ncbi:MAG: family 78 glycoside hydrolase catalytic domain [Bacteroidota bacterium]|nr:family 78 glycoside hydrolase catalytic domain [Bacteroidota bacterium]
MKNLFLIITLLLIFLSGHSQELQVTNLRCEFKTNPLGVESTSPLLQWQIFSTQRNTVQKAYRILVSDNPESIQKNIGNIWDSHQISSDASINISYAGTALEPAKTYYWKVMIWDNKNRVSTWSPAAQWQMGLLKPSDWKGAQWIGYEQLPDSCKTIMPIHNQKDKFTGNNILPLLRKEFKVKKAIKKASMFICGLGQFEMNLNGQKIGDHFLDPGWTKYDKQALYVSFDLTQNIKRGDNALGVMLGNGFYYIPPVKQRHRYIKTAFGYPKMICRLVLEYKDGTTENIISDNSWKCTPGPITYSNIYGGEDYNANLEQQGWDKPVFNDKDWKKVVTVDGPPQLNAQMEEPLKVMEEFSAQKITKTKNGWIYDLGQNASGIIRLKVQGKKGDTIKVTPSELLNDDGTPNQQATGKPYYFKYILKGNGVETWQPRFSYYGFRYLQLEGGVPSTEPASADLPKITELKGLHTRNATQQSGDFQNSNDLFNRTNKLIDWAIKSNMVSLFTDCPHREKLGWMEQDHLMYSSVAYNYDIATLSRKLTNDIIMTQNENGLVPEIVPQYVKFTWGGDLFQDSPEWGSTGIIMPWYAYQWYGDRQNLANSYSMMQRYISYLGSKANDHILSQGLGDWYDIGKNPPGVSQLTPKGVTATAIYYYDLTIMSKIAQLLGKSDDAAAYEKLASEVKNAFNRNFFNKETKQYGTGSQTANAMAIYMKLVEPEYKEAILDNLIKDVRNHNNSLTAGDIGYRYLLRVLDDEGRSDVIFDMNNRSDVPGYGYQLAKGATALTESWQAYANASNNHFMLGHLMEWFYSALAGIRQTENSVAFHNIEIRPEPVGDVTSAKANYQSPYGLISSEWKKTNNHFELTVQIPANTQSTIYLLAKDDNKIFEGDKPVLNREDVKLIRKENGKAIIQTGSGVYHFSVKLN